MSLVRLTNGEHSPEFQARIDKAKAGAKKKREATKKSLEDNNYGLRAEETALPAPVADPHGMFFTDEEKEALTATDNDATTALAFVVATPEKRALMGKKPNDK